MVIKKDTAKGSMDFPQAITEITSGKKIRRLAWENEETYGLLYETRLKLHKPDGQLYDWVLTDGDLLGVDWVSF